MQLMDGGKRVNLPSLYGRVRGESTFVDKASLDSVVRMILRIPALGKIKVNAWRGRAVVPLILNLDYLRKFFVTRVLCFGR